MKKSELHEKNDKELILEVNKLTNEYRDLKFKKVSGVIENPLKLRTLRRDIARINTILHMRDIERIKKEMNEME